MPDNETNKPITEDANTNPESISARPDITDGRESDNTQNSLEAEGKESLQVEEVNPAALVEPLANNMPDVTDVDDGENKESVIDNSEQVNKPTDFNAQELFGEIDSDNTVFDSNRHAVDKDGLPKKNKRGRFYSNKLGRAGSAAKAARESETPNTSESFISGLNNPASDIPNDPLNGSPAPAPIGGSYGGPDEFDAAAESYFNMASPLLCSIISDEFEPDNETEKKTITIPLAQHMRETGIIHLTTGQLLTVGIAAYVGKRTRRPKTKEKIIMGWAWVKMKYKGFKDSKKAGGKR